MTGVLHLQTRAYPLQHGSMELAADVLDVPGRGEVRLRPGTLGSQVYNPEPTIEADLTELVRATVALPGTEIVSCRARLLTAGTVLLVYALRHDRDLADLDVYGLADFDAEVNRRLRDGDGELVGEVLHAAMTAGVLRELVPRPGHLAGASLAVIDRKSVRYNCHLVTAGPSWSPDPRVPKLWLGPRCHVLLPYTYAWDADPETFDFDSLLTIVEPTDIVTAQLSTVFSATFGGRRILDELSRAQVGRLRGEDLRRFLDRVWSSYHQLDSYRLESAQHHRANYLAAREVIGLDRAHQRAGELLDYVATSLLAESSRRSQRLDSRLNRVAAGLTVVVAAAFAVDLAAFMLPDAGTEVRLLVGTGVPVLSTAGLLATVLSVRRQRERRGGGQSTGSGGRGRRSGPTTAAVPAPGRAPDGEAPGRDSAQGSGADPAGPGQPYVQLR